MSEHDDALYLIHMLESAQKAQAFIKDKSRADYNADEVLRLALAHLVQGIGGAARNNHRNSMESNYGDTPSNCA